MKEKIISILFVTILFSFMVLGFIIKDREVSNFERRKLSTITNLKENFFDNLDDYLIDQFPFRDDFISFNSFYNRYLLFNNEYNEVYIKDGYIIDKNYPLDEKSLNGFINKLNYVKDKYLSSSNNVFYSIIPDKAYYLDEDKYLKLDYDYVLDKLESQLNINYINIISKLKLDDYYKTDIHIKQDGYFEVIKELGKYLDFNYMEMNYKKNIYNNFYGASYSKVLADFPSDSLVYLSNDSHLNVEVNHLEYGKKPIYDLEKLKEVDSYSVFLSGPSALIEIVNNNEDVLDRELIVFRDSFGSSMIPLLIPYYKKITLIDLRYINMDLVENYVDFNNKDVLFIYSTLIVNTSNLLKVNICE